MIERVLRLADKPVRAIMTPRTELAWIDRTDPRRDIVATLTSAPHSRFVVCDGAVDNVVGVVQAKDLLDRLLDGGDLSIGAALRQPIVVPDTVSALDALERLKSDPLGLALVMDEYGSFEGLVTAADVLEAIVGDPTDAAPQSGGKAGAAESVLVMDGLMPVDELKSRLELPDLLLPFSLPSICRKKITAAFDGGLISSDGGVLLLAGADRRLGLIDTLAGIIPDHRNRALITHSMADILRARVFAIACGYPDADDLDDLRKVPRLQTCLRATARKRRRSALTADNVTLGERSGSAHLDPADARNGGSVVQELQARAERDHARYR